SINGIATRAILRIPRSPSWDETPIIAKITMSTASMRSIIATVDVEAAGGEVCGFVDVLVVYDSQLRRRCIQRPRLAETGVAHKGVRSEERRVGEEGRDWWR